MNRRCILRLWFVCAKTKLPQNFVPFSKTPFFFFFSATTRALISLCFLQFHLPQLIQHSFFLIPFLPFNIPKYLISHFHFSLHSLYVSRCSIFFSPDFFRSNFCSSNLGFVGHHPGVCSCWEFPDLSCFFLLACASRDFYCSFSLLGWRCSLFVGVLEWIVCSVSKYLLISCRSSIARSSVLKVSFFCFVLCCVFFWKAVLLVRFFLLLHRFFSGFRLGHDVGLINSFAPSRFVFNFCCFG